MNSRRDFQRIRKEIIQSAEKQFLEEIHGYVGGMEIPSGAMDDLLNLSSQTWEWLGSHVGLQSEDYLAFPQNAMGRYKDRWNWIYFKRSQDAILFKLTWA